MDRAYWNFNDQWKHVYILETYTQVDIFGGEIDMADVKLSKGSKEIYKVEWSKLQADKPKARRKVKAELL